MTTLLLLTLLTTPSAKADVNMKDASYYKTWIDLEMQKGERAFQLRRTYQSRSLHQGLFGFGWCSDLEKSLDLSRSDQITLQDCRLNAPIRFKKIRKNLFQSPDLETLEFKDQSYLRTTTKKTLQKYNRSGQLVNLTTPNGDRLNIYYTPTGFLQSLSYNDSPALAVTLDVSRKKILAVSSRQYPGATYRYKNHDLIQVTNAWGHRFDYQYDDFHNLTRIHYPGSKQELITYDTEKDWVVKVKNRQGCEHVFKYRLEGSHNDYTASAEKRCGEQAPLKTVYEFRHKARADGSTYLDQVQMTQGKKLQKRISYQLQGSLHDLP